jgi:molybdopterin synthase catalytic subunit
MGELVHVRVSLFGPAVDAAGTDRLEFALGSPAVLGDLIGLLCAKYPRLAAAGSSLRYAVNEEYAGRDRPLADGDEVAVIPPVAGGQEVRVQLTREPVSAAQLAPLVSRAGCGAIVTFEGIVRAEQSEHGSLEALEYSAHESMALRLMERIREHVTRRFAVADAVFVHRLGRLAIGECSIAIAVAAPHRGAAFEACRFIIEAVKADVPIWKKDIWSDGQTSWVDPTANAGL